MIFAVPAHADGSQRLTVTDPATGSSSTISNALTYGATAARNIFLTGGSLNPSTPVGAPAVSPMSLRVLAADGLTPVGGATIGLTASNGLQLSACSGASACSVTTDQSGNAVTLLTPAAVGTSTITATLAPGVYTPSKSVEPHPQFGRSPRLTSESLHPTCLSRRVRLSACR